MGKKLDLIYLDTTYLDPKVCSARIGCDEDGR